MTLYKTKSKTVEAIQFTEDNIKEVLVFLGKMHSVDYIFTHEEELKSFKSYKSNAFQFGIDIKIDEYILKAHLSDYIIKYEDGAFGIYNEDLFRYTFEEMTLDNLLKEMRGR